MTVLARIPFYLGNLKFCKMTVKNNGNSTTVQVCASEPHTSYTYINITPEHSSLWADTDI